ncbi:MAG: hypothetical protein Q7Q71_11380 [Verrucomicrobiota bacterium JB023]|nr:hypothetical protein [Verrucomicrobiota bacterium JB023]
MSPADAHALTQLAILVIAIGLIALLFVLMARNGQRNRNMDLPEIEEEKPRKRASPPPAKKPETPPWEKDADWWKEND